jgi:periplasmic copper chaperone A
MRMRAGAAILTLVLALAVSACGSSAGQSGGGFVTVGGAWVRAASGGATTAAYLNITNGTFSDETLVGVTTSVAQSASLHETTTDASGMTGMQPVPGIPIKAGQTVNLEPGGYHIMLENLTGDLQPGGSVQLTLTFAQAGPLNVQAEVRGS